MQTTLEQMKSHQDPSLAAWLGSYDEEDQNKRKAVELVFRNRYRDVHIDTSPALLWCPLAAIAFSIYKLHGCNDDFMSIKKVLCDQEWEMLWDCFREYDSEKYHRLACIAQLEAKNALIKARANEETAKQTREYFLKCNDYNICEYVRDSFYELYKEEHNGNSDGWEAALDDMPGTEYIAYRKEYEDLIWEAELESRHEARTLTNGSPTPVIG